MGFVHLRDRVPHSTSSKKLSKVETLREAARYIKHLQDLLRLSCDEKPFEPISTTETDPSSFRSPSTSQENFYQPPTVAECLNTSYQVPGYEQQYYLPYTPAPYCRPTFGTPFPNIKVEDSSPNSSSCSSENSVEGYRFQQKSYML